MKYRAFKPVVSAACLAALLGAVGCGGGGTTVVESAGSTGNSGIAGIAGDWAWSLPSFFPTPKVAADNPMSAEKVALGRWLFHDKRLSGNGRQACAGCHVQALAFTDGRAQAIGSTGELHPRGAQQLANVVYNATLTWANPSLVTLERQMETPLFGEQPVEMGVNDGNKDAVLARLRDDDAASAYPQRFAAAYPGQAQPINWGNVIKSIAAFQRSLISGNSRYDQWLAGKATLSDAQQRGMKLFFGEKAECFHCHGSFNFNDQTVNVATRVVETPFHNTGLFNIGGTGAYPEPNRGVMELSGLFKDMGAFRAPSLRNVAVTAPYMHDGSVATLEEAVDIFAEGGRNVTSGPYAGDGRLNPYKSPLIRPLGLSAQDKADLVAFLKTLTDTRFLTDPRHADPFAVP